MKKWGHLSGFHVSFLSYGPWIVQKSAFFSDDHRKKFRSVKAFIDMHLEELITLIAVIFDVPQFTCDLFLEMSVQLKEKDM